MIRHLVTYNGQEYWACGWCGRVYQAQIEPTCPCLRRLADHGGELAFEVKDGKARCLVCGRTWKTDGDPDDEHACGPDPGHGPGTELKKILKQFGFEACAQCRDRALLMDKWGPDKCDRKRETIISWLQDEAAARGWETLGGVMIPTLIEVAIRRARKSSVSGTPEVGGRH